MRKMHPELVLDSSQDFQARFQDAVVATPYSNVLAKSLVDCAILGVDGSMLEDTP